MTGQLGSRIVTDLVEKESQTKLLTVRHGENERSHFFLIRHLDSVPMTIGSDGIRNL